MESKQEEKFMLKQAEEDLKKKQEEAKEEPKQAAGQKAESAKEEKKPGAAKETKAPAKKEEKKEEEKKREIVLERLYTIPVKKFLIQKPRMKRHTRSPNVVRTFAAKHMKVAMDKVKLEPKVWESLSRSGRAKVPAKLKVKMSKDKEGIVLVELA
ncbi:TPA: hypothetical protein HA244_03225 [Candidatus Micrarchaeota archaeon]|nr:hypothetical protein [Candidatus Micrarchaeota archaeon]